MLVQSKVQVKGEEQQQVRVWGKGQVCPPEDKLISVYRLITSLLMESRRFDGLTETKFIPDSDPVLVKTHAGVKIISIIVFCP